MHDHLPITIPKGFYAAASGGLGWALPAAVGIALASPGRRVLCLLGEGSSMYSIQAVWTAVQLELPIAFIVLDNRAYLALKALGAAFGVNDDPPRSTLVQRWTSRPSAARLRPAPGPTGGSGRGARHRAGAGLGDPRSDHDDCQGRRHRRGAVLKGAGRRISGRLAGRGGR